MAQTSAAPHDDTLTVIAISAIAVIVSTMLHEGVGHGATALLTGATSGTISTVAWSSDYNSRLVLAGGTLANLTAALIFWLLLRVARNASAPVRFFLLISMAFNLFSGTGYFLFSGVSNFGDWAGVIAGLLPSWLWRLLLILVGALSYWGAMVAVGTSIARYLGVPPGDYTRFRRLTWIPYLTAIVTAVIAGAHNPLGLPLVFESALPATAGGQCGLLFMKHYLPRRIEIGPQNQPISRSYEWTIAAAVLVVVFVVVLGPGIQVHR